MRTTPLIGLTLLAAVVGCSPVRNDPATDPPRADARSSDALNGRFVFHIGGMKRINGAL